MLNTGLPYFLCGHFQSDIIEKEFGKCRQGSGGTYLITAQNVFQKYKIDCARKYLRTLTSEDEEGLFQLAAAHVCHWCDGDRECDDIDVDELLQKASPELSMEVRNGLCYVSGYIGQKESSSIK